MLLDRAGAAEESFQKRCDPPPSPQLGFERVAAGIAHAPVVCEESSGEQQRREIDGPLAAEWRHDLGKVVREPGSVSLHSVVEAPVDTIDGHYRARSFREPFPLFLVPVERCRGKGLGLLPVVTKLAADCLLRALGL